jgi:NADP-dependent 3-hydroxy acid dehydrogenase YdfG
MSHAILSSGRNALRRSLVGRKVVITGAARGIGEGVARLAVARGARVALIGLEPDRLRVLAEDLGTAASWYEADVRNGTALQSAIDDAAQGMGGLDIVVANAGVAAYGNRAAGR